MEHESLKKLHILLTLAVLINLGFWTQTYRLKTEWANVPPPPTEKRIVASFLGDRALAYRVWALALQNFGNSGGRMEALKAYNYTNLGHWFDLMDRLDPHSDFIPFLAAYYFGGTQNPKEQLPPIVAFLEKVGIRPEGEKWRWLAQAVYLARHPMDNQAEALRLAKELRTTFRPGMPAWVLQMEGMVASDQGDKQAAYNLMVAILATNGKHMQPQEVNFMVDYICTRILTGAQAEKDPLCFTDAAKAGDSTGRFKN